MSRIVVTGAAGFIGSHVSEALLARGDEVVGIDNFDPTYPQAVKERNLTAARARPGFRFLEADITDRAGMATALEGAACVIHLAARAGVRPSVDDPSGYVQSNVLGTASVLEAARRQGLSRVVLASSSSVYGDDSRPPFTEDAAATGPVSPYAATKRAAELLAACLTPLAGFRLVTLRYFTVYGPRQRPDLAIHTFARQMLAGEPVVLFGDQGSRRDYTFISDIVEGTLAAVDFTRDADPGFEVVNLASGRPVALRELVERLSGLLGITPQVRLAPPRPGDVAMTWGDIAKAGRLFDYHPRVGFEPGLSAFLEWYRGVHA